MRLAVVTQSRDRVGGVEAYLERLIPALAREHDVAFWSASSETTERGPIALPPEATVLTGDRRPADSIRELRDWQPDLLFAHGLDDAPLESEILHVAPAVVVAHTYHGTCISSAKTMSWPGIHPCDRRFGTACLALYFPRRCGGLNPMTMVRFFRTQSTRLDGLKSAAAVVTLSAHMAEEMLRNGVPRERVHVVRPFVIAHAGPVWTVTDSEGPCRLLFLGRLERLKGVGCLLKSLEFVVERLGRPVRLVVAGEGAERGALQASADALQRTDSRIDVQFAGWQDGGGRARLLAESDVLVVPSLWPEPFGLVGLEAAAAGVPAVAFATGGIPEWLRDGENGCLAPAGGGSQALAGAIVRCLESPATLGRLSAGARAAAACWTLEQHVMGLERIFRIAVGESQVPAPAASTSTHYA